jgi:hypothetical protein
MDKVEFFCTLKQIKVDKENEATLTLTLDASQARQIMEFYADNTEVLISAAFVAIPNRIEEYNSVKENINTGEIKEGE